MIVWLLLVLFSPPQEVPCIREEAEVAAVGPLAMVTERQVSALSQGVKDDER